MKNNVDAITTFPSETEKPTVREQTNRLQVVDIAVSGDMDPFTLKQVTERVRDELTAIPGITQVDIVSAPPYEISIEVSENDLRRHRLTFDLTGQGHTTANVGNAPRVSIHLEFADQNQHIGPLGTRQ